MEKSSRKRRSFYFFGRKRTPRESQRNVRRGDLVFFFIERGRVLPFFTRRRAALLARTMGNAGNFYARELAIGVTRLYLYPAQTGGSFLSRSGNTAAAGIIGPISYIIVIGDDFLIDFGLRGGSSKWRFGGYFFDAWVWFFPGNREFLSSGGPDFTIRLNMRSRDKIT